MALFHKQLGTDRWNGRLFGTAMGRKAQVYDPNGDQGVLAGSELYAANLSYRGGHPGAGRDQTKANLDHYVIAAYDVPTDGIFRIESGWLVRRESREDIVNQAVNLVVHVNEKAPIFSETCNRDGLLKFCCPLGSLREGDRVHVAVGPYGVDFNDRFEWDFAIVREIDPQRSSGKIDGEKNDQFLKTLAW